MLMHIWAHVYIVFFSHTQPWFFFLLKMHPKNHSLSVDFELNNCLKWLCLIPLYEKFSRYLFGFLSMKHFCVTNTTSMNTCKLLIWICTSLFIGAISRSSTARKMNMFIQIFKKLKYSWFKMFQVYYKVIQLYISIFFRFFSIIGY